MAGSDYEHKPNSGTMFPNKYKTADNHPDMKGDGKGVCPRCGEEWPVDLALWKRKAKASGKGYISVSFAPDDRPQEQAMQEPGDTEIPF